MKRLEHLVQQDTARHARQSRRTPMKEATIQRRGVRDERRGGGGVRDVRERKAYHRGTREGRRVIARSRCVWLCRYPVVQRVTCLLQEKRDLTRMISCLGCSGHVAARASSQRPKDDRHTAYGNPSSCLKYLGGKRFDSQRWGRRSSVVQKRLGVKKKLGARSNFSEKRKSANVSLCADVVHQFAILNLLCENNSKHRYSPGPEPPKITITSIPSDAADTRRQLHKQQNHKRNKEKRKGLNEKLHRCRRRSHPLSTSCATTPP